MNLLKVCRDFLLLELRKDNLKYLYGGCDSCEPEPLDMGSVELAWELSNQYLGELAMRLRPLVAERFSPQGPLETYLILLPEMVQLAEVVFPSAAARSITDWKRWELSQRLPESLGAVQSEFGPAREIPGIRFSAAPAAGASVAQIDRLVRVLGSLSLLVNGSLVPQQLWGALVQRWHSRDAAVILIYKEHGKFYLIERGPRSFPRIHAVHSNGMVADAPTPVDLAAAELAALAGGFHPPGTGPASSAVIALESNLSPVEQTALQSAARAQLQIVPETDWPPALSGQHSLDYLLLAQAFEEVSRTYVGN